MTRIIANPYRALQSLIDTELGEQRHWPRRVQVREQARQRSVMGRRPFRDDPAKALHSHGDFGTSDACEEQHRRDVGGALCVRMHMLVVHAHEHMDAM